MASGLATSLIKRVASVGDPKVRVGLLRAMLPELPPEALAEAMREIASRAGMRESAAQVTLLALTEALDAARVEALAKPGVAPAAEGTDWGMGRPLTLGERKSLARRPERRLLERALRDSHPDVVAQVLLNPRLTEGDVARMCAAPTTPREVLARVFAAPRWAVRPRVRRALASNPHTPPEVALALVPLLGRQELQEIAADTRVANAVRAQALAILRRLPPTPDGTGELH